MPPAALEPGLPAGTAMQGWRYRALLVSVLLAAAAYLGFAFWSGWHEVSLALARVGITGVAVALVLSLFNYGLRFLRWQRYLTTLGHHVPWWPSLRMYLAGFTLTTTPGKAGEVLRGVLLKPWGIPYPKSLAALLSERLSDLTAVLLLTLFGLSLYPAAKVPVIAAALLILIAIVLLSNERMLDWFGARLAGSGRMTLLLRHVLEMLRQAARCHAPRLLLGATVLSVLAWGAEAWAFHLVLGWLDIPVGFAFAVFVYAVAMLAGAASFMPGGLGGAEAAMTGLLVWAGAALPDAAAATLIIRLATLWFAVAIGAASLLIREDVMAQPIRGNET